MSDRHTFVEDRASFPRFQMLLVAAQLLILIWMLELLKPDVSLLIIFVSLDRHSLNLLVFTVTSESAAGVEVGLGG